MSETCGCCEGIHAIVLGRISVDLVVIRPRHRRILHIRSMIVLTYNENQTGTEADCDSAVFFAITLIAANSQVAGRCFPGNEVVGHVVAVDTAVITQCEPIRVERLNIVGCEGVAAIQILG